MVRAGLVTGVLAVALAMGSGLAVSQESKALPVWGVPVEPDGDRIIRLDGEALVFSVPGTPHDLRGDSGTKNAPRVLRDVEGNHESQLLLSGDLDAEVDGPGAARGAGLVLWQDERNFVLLLRRVEGASEGGKPRDVLRLEYWKDGQLQPTPAGTAEVPLEGDSTWLRLTRRMDTIKAEASRDGQTWSEAQTIPVRLSSRLRLGPIVTNTSGQPLTVRFEEFRFRSIPLYP